jgi:hypothetical protein
MPHAAIHNRTPFCVTPLFLTDNDLRPVVVPLIRATYVIQPDGALVLHDEQQAPKLAGEFWGDPLRSSYKYEPECAFFKPATDIVLIGHAHAPHVGATEVHAGIRVGALQKVVRVIGDRVMSRGWNGWSLSAPQPFETIPLRYERAFGGWDRHHEDPACHRFEPRNPVGMGFRHESSGATDDLPMPNIEDPAEVLARYGDTPAPAGLGFTSPHWQPRAQWRGTYDQAWEAQRKPLLPVDFDSRYFNAASAGLIAPGYLAGDEAVAVVNASAGGRLVFNLPGVAAPVCECEFVGRRHHTIQTQLDTVIVNTDDHTLHLLWRGHRHVRGGPHDVVAMTVSSATHAAPPSTQAA